MINISLGYVVITYPQVEDAPYVLYLPLSHLRSWLTPYFGIQELVLPYNFKKL